MINSHYAIGKTASVTVEMSNGVSLHFDDCEVEIDMNTYEVAFSDGSKMAIENPTPVVKIRSEVTPEEFEEKDRILTRLIRGD